MTYRCAPQSLVEVRIQCKSIYAGEAAALQQLQNLIIVGFTTALVLDEADRLLFH